jgi:phytoene desaturase
MLSPQDAGGFTRLMAENRDKLARFRPVLESDFSSFRDYLRPDVLKLLPDLFPARSLHGELARYFSDPRLQLAFTFQAKYLGMSPFRCPSLFSILSHLEYEHGVWHPMGGFGAVSEAMARVARDLGARIHLGEPVQELLFEGKRVVGLRTDSGEHRGDAVVVNADFSRAMQRLVPNARRKGWSDRKIAKAKYSCSTFMLYLGIEGRVDLPHHTIYVPEGYAEHLDDIEVRKVLSEDPSFYVQNACVTDPGQAPDGHSASTSTGAWRRVRSGRGSWPSWRSSGCPTSRGASEPSG